MKKTTSSPSTPTKLHALERRVEILEALVLQLSRGAPAPLVLNSTAHPAPPIPQNASQVGHAFSPRESWIPLVHRNGEYPCHKTAWYLIRKFWRGEKGDLEAIRLLNGSIPEIGDAPLCGSCQRPVHPFTQQDLDFEPALVNHPSQLDKVLAPDDPDYDGGYEGGY
jgi:hypothetical protein